MLDRVSAAGIADLTSDGWIDIKMLKTVSAPLSQSQNPHRTEPADKPGLNLIGKDKVKPKRPSMWNIVLYNDDYTPMDFVEFVLLKIFSYADVRCSRLDLGHPYERQGYCWYLHF